MDKDVLSFVSQSIVVSAMNLLLFMFYKNIYGCKYEKKSYYVVGYLIADILLLCVNLMKIPYLNMAYSFISFNIICMILFESNIKKVWLNNLLLWFMVLFSDSITVLIWSLVKDKTVSEILSDSQLKLYCNISYIILMFAFYRVYITIVQKINVQGIKFKVAAFTIIITFFEGYAVLAFAEEVTDRYGGVKLLILLIGYLIINLFYAYILNQVSQAYKYKYELSLAERLNEMCLSNYMEINHKYDESRAIIHDIKKHISVAENIKANDEQTKYLSEVYERMNDMFNFFHCSNKILSIILSQKISYAKSKGIKVNVSAEDVPMDHIRDFDITAIFANLWDNAIEACDKVDENKYITMDISKRNNFLLINIENSFNGVIIKDKDVYKSTKPDHDGMGLKSIQLVVEKYNGVFMASYNESAFRAEITLFLT